MFAGEQEGDLNAFSVKTFQETMTPAPVNKQCGQHHKLVVSADHLETPGW